MAQLALLAQLAQLALFALLALIVFVLIAWCWLTSTSWTLNTLYRKSSGAQRETELLKNDGRSIVTARVFILLAGSPVIALMTACKTSVIVRQASGWFTGQQVNTMHGVLRCV